jgi:Anticodon binding domain
MISETANAVHSAANPITVVDVAAILRARGWLREETEAAFRWMEEARAMLGPRVVNCNQLAALLGLIFEYDARAVLAVRASQEVVCRAGARQVLRALAADILSRGAVDSGCLKEIVNAVMAKVPYRSREIFLPLRVAVAGCAGDGALDRVILLIDRAAGTRGLAPVKSVRARILEFCATLD